MIVPPTDVIAKLRTLADRWIREPDPDGFTALHAGQAIRAILGECTCPGGLPDGWKTDFDRDCRRNGIPEVTDDELRALLPAARAALGWAVGARANVYHDDPAKTDRDGMLVNVIVAVLDELRTPAEVKELRRD